MTRRRESREIWRWGIALAVGVALLFAWAMGWLG